MQITRTQLVSLIGNLFSAAEIRDARLRLPHKPENTNLWGLLHDAELGDYLDESLQPVLVELERARFEA